MDDSDTEKTTRHVCPVCGYSRRDVSAVVEHIDSQHPTEGHVRILTDENATPNTHTAVFQWFKRRLRQLKQRLP